MPEPVVHRARQSTRSGASPSILPSRPYFPLVGLRSGGAAVVSVSSWTFGRQRFAVLLSPPGVAIEPLHLFRAYPCPAQPCLARFFAASFGAPHRAADVD